MNELPIARIDTDMIDVGFAAEKYQVARQKLILIYYYTQIGLARRVMRQLIAKLVKYVTDEPGTVEATRPLSAIFIGRAQVFGGFGQQQLGTSHNSRP